MIAPMTKYSFILLNGMQEDLVEALQEIGLVDITRDYRNLDSKGQDIKTDIELLDGLVKGLNKVEVPEGTVPEHMDLDIERLAGGMLMRYTTELEEFKDLHKLREEALKWGDTMDMDATLLWHWKTQESYSTSMPFPTNSSTRSGKTIISSA